MVWCGGGGRGNGEKESGLVVGTGRVVALVVAVGGGVCEVALVGEEWW